MRGGVAASDQPVEMIERVAEGAEGFAERRLRFSWKISRQTRGSEAAMRVVSLKPRAARSRKPGSSRTTASTSASATRCGRWLMAATARS